MPARNVYSDQTLVKELRRVAALTEGPLTRAQFVTHSPVNCATMLRRFGSWSGALAAAGLQHRDRGQRVTAKMRAHRRRTLTDEQVLEEIRRVAGSVEEPLTLRLAQEISPLLGRDVLTTRFGSWRAAAEAAGLDLSKMANRWTDQELRDNLQTVRRFHDRELSAGDMNRPPSRITSETYRRRFGTWEEVAELLNVDSPTDTGHDETS